MLESARQQAEAHGGSFPRVIFDVDRLLVDLSDIVTVGGVMAWTDLALHLPERFGGRSLSRSDGLRRPSRLSQRVQARDRLS